MSDMRYRGFYEEMKQSGLSEHPEKNFITGCHNEEEVKEKAETGYKDKIQTEYAEARIDEMVKAQKVEKVKSVWDTLEKFH